MNANSPNDALFSKTLCKPGEERRGGDAKGGNQLGGDTQRGIGWGWKGWDWEFRCGKVEEIHREALKN